MGLGDYGVWDELLSLGSLDTGSLVLSLSLPWDPGDGVDDVPRIAHCSLTSKCFSEYLFFLHSYVGSLIYIKHMLWNEVINSSRLVQFGPVLLWAGIFLVLGRKG